MIFTELAIILSLACLFALFTLKLKLPSVVAYLLAGVALAVFESGDASVLHTLPEIGIAFVLFLVGMELNFNEIRSLGKPIVVATLLQVALSSVVGYWIATLFGFAGAEAVLLGTALAFSSTVVIVKSLLEKRDLGSLYGKLSVGILLIEDLVAILLMTAISSDLLKTGIMVADFTPFLAFIAKAIILMAVAYLASHYLLNRLFDIFARSTELLFLAAIAWCFAITSLAVLAGFSVVIGAFIAGIALATSPYEIQIQGKVKPLRDFFVALFFVYIGAQVELQYVINAWPMVLAFAGIALFIKPLIYLIGLSAFGFRKHTMFQTALNLTQVSEFSLIVLLLGLQYGLIAPQSLSVIAAAAVVSIIVSAIFIEKSDALYKVMKPFVALFQHKKERDLLTSEEESKLVDHVVVIGADRVGSAIVHHMVERQIPVLVLDYNPRLVRRLRAEGIRTIYGDISDPEIIEHLHLETAHLVISTASGIVDTKTLLEACKRKKVKATVVVRAAEPEHEQMYLDMGADYVIVPEHVSGDFLVAKLKNEWPELTFEHHTHSHRHAHKRYHG